MSAYQMRHAINVVLQRFPATISLAVSALTIAVPLGVYAGMHHTRLDGRIINWFAGILQAMPTFWLGLIFLLIFPSSCIGSAVLLA